MSAPHRPPDGLRPVATSLFPAELHQAMKSLDREHGFEPLEVEGRLPEELSGTLFRNGPALLELFGRRYEHWFEGDGGVSAVRFSSGQAEGAIRLVQSAGLQREREAGRMLYGFSQSQVEKWRQAATGVTKNTANTSVVVWQDRLFALMEAGLPTELDPDTLETLGETSLDGAVPSTFSAHPHRVAARRATYNFGVRYGKESFLDLFELPDVGEVRRLASLPLRAPVMLHDFIATERHLVFFVSPARLQVWRALLGMGSITDLFQWRPDEGTEVIVVPIDDPERPRRFEVEAFYQWHFANAFERGSELVVDFCRYPDFTSFEDIGSFTVGDPRPAREHGHLHRAVIGAEDRLVEEVLHDRRSEFPRVGHGVEGTEHRYVYLLCTDDYDTIAKVDVQTGAVESAQFERHRYPSEPVFCARAGATSEDDGWLVTPVFDATQQRTGYSVLDARKLEDGPVGTAWFNHALPLTFHGVWRPAAS